jgi:hypothetical protein
MGRGIVAVVPSTGGRVPAFYIVTKPELFRQPTGGEPAYELTSDRNHFLGKHAWALLALTSNCWAN